MTLPISEALLYLRQTIAYKKRDWVAVYLNLRKYRRRWGMTVRVLERIVATVQSWGAMYKTMAQSVLLYGIEIWMMTGEMLKALMAFHHQAARHITGMTAKRGAGG